MKTACGKLMMLAFILLTAVLLLAPMRAGREDELLSGVDRIRMNPGDTYVIECSLLAEKAQTVSFASDRPTVAAVDVTGKVTGIAPGTATIHLTAQRGAKATVQVEVVGTAVTSFALNTHELNLEKGEVSGLSCVFNEGVTGQRVDWRTSDSSVVKVDGSGRLLAVGGGEAYVVATCGKFSDAVKVRVEVRSSVVLITPGDLTVGVGARIPLQLHCIPEDATDQPQSWASSDPSVVSVDGTGVLRARTAGRATVRVQTESGLEANINVVVESPADSFLLNPTRLTLERGEAFDFDAYFIDALGNRDDSVNHHIDWSVDSDVVTIKNGHLTAMKSGTAKVTASADGHNAACLVQVTTTAKEISLNMDEVWLLKEQTDQTFQLIPTVLPADADSLRVIYTTNNELVANADENGLVTLTGGYGTAVITAINAGGARATFTVNVVAELPEGVNPQ